MRKPTARAGIHGSASNGDVFTIVPRFRETPNEAGRAPESCPFCLFSTPVDVDTLNRCRDLGIVYVSVNMSPALGREVLPSLDRWAASMRQV
jgi:hypothetical protein